MKPRNKFEKEIVRLSSKLPKVNEVQEKWAFKHCFEHIGRRLKNGVISCTECGSTWKDKEVMGKAICPHCKAELNISDTRKSTFRWNTYFGMFTTIKGMQVIRYFYIDAFFKAGRKAQYNCYEVVQRWIAPNGKQTTLARLRTHCFTYSDVWDLFSRLEVRKEHLTHDIFPEKYYPRQQFIPEIKRSGFSGDCMNFHPSSFFGFLLSDYRAETLLKTGQIHLFDFFCTSRNRRIDYFWASIRICIRNGFTIQDPSLWCDYIEYLHHYGKDIRNSKYVCPDNLKAEHDRYLIKRREENQRREVEDKRKKMEEEDLIFKAQKANFFGLCFTDGIIQIRVLESVNEFFEESRAMHHCVYINNYHLFSDSLILSASIDGKRIETVEVSLSTLRVVQSRGLLNQNTEYHDQIIQLVNKNINKISQKLIA